MLFCGISNGVHLEKFTWPIGQAISSDVDPLHQRSRRRFYERGKLLELLLPPPCPPGCCFVLPFEARSVGAIFKSSQIGRTF